MLHDRNECICLLYAFAGYLYDNRQSGNDARMRITIFHRTKWREARGTSKKRRIYIHWHKQENIVTLSYY